MSDNDEGQDLYDEFGNYIGPELSDDDDDSSSEDQDDDDDVDDNSSIGKNDNNRTDAMAIIPTDDDNDKNTTSNSAIVLHEDKEHYLSANEVYGEDVHIAVLDEDAMDLDKPIVEPVITKTHQSDKTNSIKDDDLLYSIDFLISHLSNETTRTRRGIAFVGHLHHGKTCLIDMLLESTIKKQNYWGPRASLNVNDGGGPRYLDIWTSEQERQMSIVSTPITTLLQDTRGKSICCTIIDTPGHVNFHDESVASMRLMDSVVIVIDVVEGIMIHTEMVIKQAVLVEGVPIVVVLNKMDRLIVELKLPPRDAYYKLLNIIDTMNEYISDITNGTYPIKLSPERGNVAFASAQHGYLFTLQSFAQLYVDHHVSFDDTENNTNNTNFASSFGSNLSVPDFAIRLWGDCYLDPITKTFHTSVKDCPSISSNNTMNLDEPIKIERTFVTYILEPLYKIYSVCLGEKESDVNQLLRSVGVYLTKEQLRSSARPLLRYALSKFFGTSTNSSSSSSGAFVDMIVQHTPYPLAASYGKVARCYSGPVTIVSKQQQQQSKPQQPQPQQQSKIVQSMIDCNPNGPLIIHCVKNYSNYSDGKTFMTLGRIYSGTVHVQQTIKVLGESYSPLYDDEDIATAVIETVAIPRGRGYIEVSAVKAGNWVLLQGIDSTITKTATIVSLDVFRNNSGNNHNSMDDDENDMVHVFAPLKFPHAGNESVMKIAIEPINPSDLPKMIDGLRKITKAYPMSKTKVEESGEHILLGTGEMYMDCMMYDLRTVYSNIEIKVSDPIVSFRETVIDSSIIKCYGDTANKRNRFAFITEPLDDGLAEQLEVGKIKINEWDNKKLGRFFQTQYNWDLLSSRSVWAFGDSATHGTNILLDDTLESEIDKSLLHTCKASIVQGFQWATREGPLCEEPVRSTKIKLIETTLSDRPIYRGSGQVIPTIRRVIHTSIVTASAKLMEPIYQVQIQCPTTIVDTIQPILLRRRGYVTKDRPISGTILSTIQGYIPILDSFGFETDLRTYTQGQAMVYSIFDHWAIVPGNPLDNTIVIHPLEPSPNHHLARELLIKTRRRKGLSEDVVISKYLDDEMKEQLLTATTTTTTTTTTEL